MGGTQRDCAERRVPHWSAHWGRAAGLRMVPSCAVTVKGERRVSVAKRKVVFIVLISADRILVCVCVLQLYVVYGIARACPVKRT